MGFGVRNETRPAGGGREASLVVLEDGAGGRASIWPALGFNCFAWQVQRDGQSIDLLYADAALFTDAAPRPTRSGIPVLFPFPNRIREGRFTWDGKEHRLPLNDSGGQNAIHGFACRHAWRVANQGADSAAAWVRGSFRPSRDAPEVRSLWPADYEIEVTYRLSPGRLRLEAEVHNPDSVPLPFGLGYHPYFRLPLLPGSQAENCTVCVPARSYWVTEDSLPTGEKGPVAEGRDLNTPRRFADLHLDDVLTDLPAVVPDADGLRPRAVLRDGAVALQLWWSDDFTDVVVFTPPHRQAFCVEPYTCTTDAVHLQARGLEVGWQVLPPGGRWAGVVELHV
jgi:aldose 1-epimerase